MGREEFLIEEASSVPRQGDTPAIGPVYRNIRAKGGYVTESGISNLWELFSRSAKQFSDRDCLGWRPQTDGKAGAFRWLTYAQVADSATQLAGAISRTGVKAHGRCAVFSTNCVEWMITMQACNHQGIYCVPLYDTLGENAVEFIINHSESAIVFTSAANLPKLVKALPSIQDQLKTVVYWGKPDAQSERAVQEHSIQIFTYDTFLETGKGSATEPVSARLTDICTIMYTSGTTGAPKGVLITHESVISCVAAQHSFMDQAHVGDISTSDSMLSFLPLAHIFDRVAEEMLLSCGSRIGYFQGDVKLLVEDIEALKPTIFVGVPRVFDRIHSGILAKVDAAGGIKKRLFQWALARKQHFIQRGFPVNKASPLADKLVFGKVKQRMGGCVRVIISGAAPLAPHVEEFLQVAMCCPVLQGYGLTESCAASFIGLPGRLNMRGTVGIPLPSHSIRLEGVPEMNYDPLAEPPKGEVCIKGLTIFKGYYKDEEKTREVLEQDGWFHTGDIAELTAGGGLKIIDRKKYIFKLAQGEYVAVEHLEANYKKLGLVGQIWVYGNSFESTLLAVVVPEESAILGWAKDAGVAGGYSDVCASKQTKDHLLQQLNATAKAAKLKGFEMLKDIKVEAEQFSVENDCMTPTFKLKRPQLQKRYQADIDEMYKAINSKR